MLSRVEETEKENTDLRLSADQRFNEEKALLLQEVDEIRKREEAMEKEIQEKLESEILKMHHD